jgi:hypothetical protein
VTPLYRATVANLNANGHVRVSCGRCSHVAEVACATLQAKLPAWFRIVDLSTVMKCTACEMKGRCSITALDALGYEEDHR